MLRWQFFFLSQISFEHRIIFARDDWVNDDDEFMIDSDDHFNEYDNNDDDDNDDDELAVLFSKCF